MYLKHLKDDARIGHVYRTLDMQNFGKLWHNLDELLSK